MFKLRILLKKIPIIDRWIIFKLIPVMFFSISAFTMISLSVGVMFDLIRKVVEFGLPIVVALKIFFLSLPSFLVIAFPMSVMLSCLLTYGNLSANSEILALKSLGVNNFRIVLPSLLLAIFMTFLTFVFNDNLVPISNRLSTDIMQNSLGKSMSTEKGRYNISFLKFGSIIDNSTNNPIDDASHLTHIFFSRKFLKKTMYDVTIVDLSRNGLKTLITANNAVFDDQNSIWRFSKGKFITSNDNGEVISSVVFDVYNYIFDNGPYKLAAIPKDANNMSISDTKKAQKMYELAGNLKESRRMKVRINEKITLPISCIIFALIGSSLGIKQNIRSSKSQGFGLSIILIFSYYFLCFVFSSLGIKGILAPYLAAWIPVLISLSAGILLILKKS